MKRPGRVFIPALLLTRACALGASQPAETTPSHSFVYVEHGIPGIYRGELRAADFNGDSKPDLVLFGAVDHFNELWEPTEDGKASARVMVYFNASTGPGQIKFAAGPGWKPGGGTCPWLDERWCGELQTFDYDADGDADVVVGGNTDQFGSHRASTKCFSQWHRNHHGRIDPDPAFFFSTLGTEHRHNTEHDGMDNGSYALTDLDRDGRLDVVFSGSHAGFHGDWEEPYWITPQNPDGESKWIHYDFFTLIQQPPFDGRHWKRWEFNGGGPGCKRTSCVAAADETWSIAARRASSIQIAATSSTATGRARRSAR